MADIFIFLIEHLGGAALVLILGLAADQISTQALKTYVVESIRQRTSPRLRSRQPNFFLAFLNGFIEPIFGGRIFSLSFFLRSSIITLIFFVVALVIQISIYGTQALYQLHMISFSISISVFTLAVLLLFNCVIDYISNAKSIALLRMAARTGRFSNVFLIFIADTTLTVWIFSFLFPWAAILVLYLAEPFRPATVIEIRPVQHPLRDLVAQETPAPASYATFKPHVFFLSDTRAGPKFSRTSPMILLYAPANASADEVFRDYANILKTLPNIQIRSVESERMIVEAKFEPLARSLVGPLLIALQPEIDVNRTLEVGIYVFRLFPYVVPFSTIYQYLSHLNFWPRALTITCLSNEVKVVSYPRSGELVPPCEPKLLAVNSGPDQEWKFRVAGSTGDGLPESPFFFTSFALANLYYALIAMFVVGLTALRLVSKIFSTPYLESANKPFTLLGLVLFPIFLVLGLLLRAIF